VYTLYVAQSKCFEPYPFKRKVQMSIPSFFSILTTFVSTQFVIISDFSSAVKYKTAQLMQRLRATTVRVYRHLGFFKFESCTISSAVPENPTLEPNSTLIGKPVTKLWPFLYIQDGRQPPSWILSNRK